MIRLHCVVAALTWAAMGCGCQASGAAAHGFQAPTAAQLFPESNARAQAPEVEPPPLVKPASFKNEGRTDLTPPSYSGPSAVAPARVMARVNGQPILVEEVRGIAADYLMMIQQQAPEAQRAQLEAEVLSKALNEMIDRELLIQDAEKRVPKRQLQEVEKIADKEFDSDLRKRKFKAGIKSDEEFRIRLEKQGQSLNEMRRQFRRDFVSIEFLKNLIMDQINSIGRAEMLEFYNKNAKEFEKKESVVWQYIFIDADRFPTQLAARKHAEGVLAKVQSIRRNEEFEALALAYSNEPAKDYRKGAGEGSARGEIRPADVEDVVFRLPPGQSYLMDTPRGFHIVRVVDHQPGGKRPFEQVSLQIRDTLRNRIFAEERKRIIEELRSKATIEILVGR
jgi:peptidyl-prolyl cis-trans isomerase SurA